MQGAHIQRARLPEAQLVVDVRVKQGDTAGKPFQHRRQGDPREGQANRAQLAAALAAGKGYQQRGAERAAKGHQQLLLRRGETKQRRAQHDSEAGAGVDAEDPGVRQRVAGQRLHQRAGQTQRAAGQQPGEGSRQPGIKDDGAIGALAGAGEGIEDDAKR